MEANRLESSEPALCFCCFRSSFRIALRRSKAAAAAEGVPAEKKKMMMSMRANEIIIPGTHLARMEAPTENYVETVQIQDEARNDEQDTNGRAAATSHDKVTCVRTN